MGAGKIPHSAETELVNEVQRLRMLVLEHAEELAMLRAETRRLRNEMAARSSRQLTAEELSFVREMGSGLHRAPRRRALNRAS